MEALGLNIVNLIINSVLFFIFAALLHKFLLSKLDQILIDRKSKVESGIQAYENAKNVLGEAQQKQDDIEKTTKHEIDVIMRQAKVKGELEYEKIIKEANEESKRTIEKTKKSLEIEKELLNQDFEKKVDQKVKEELQKLIENRLNNYISEEDVLEKLKQDL